MEFDPLLESTQYRPVRDLRRRESGTSRVMREVSEVGRSQEAALPLGGDLWRADFNLPSGGSGTAWVMSWLTAKDL